MKRELAEQLEKLVDSGEYKLEFTDSPYLDSMIDEIYEDENGNYVYNSEVFTEREMAKVPEWAIVVYKIVHNWREI